MNDADLLQVQLVFQGRDRLFRFRIPPASGVLSLIEEPEQRIADLVQSKLEIEVAKVVESVDGDEVWLDEACAIAAEGRLLGEVLSRRNRIYSTLASTGTLRARCPHCRERDAELPLDIVALGLNTAPWPIVTPDKMFVAPPSLAELRPGGARPAGIATSARLGFRLPSGGGGVLGDLGVDTALQAEAAAWRRWAPDDEERSGDRGWWRWDNPGFRALLRMTVALEELDGTELTPAALEEMPIVDFFFLDALYHLTHNVDASADSSLIIPCSGCGRRFLPVHAGGQAGGRVS